MTATRISHRVSACRPLVYRALLDALQGEMTITITLAEADSGTEVLAVSGEAEASEEGSMRHDPSISG